MEDERGKVLLKSRFTPSAGREEERGSGRGSQTCVLEVENTRAEIGKVFGV